MTQPPPGLEDAGPYAPARVHPDIDRDGDAGCTWQDYTDQEKGGPGRVRNVQPLPAVTGGADDRNEVPVTNESDNAGENGSG